MKTVKVLLACLAVIALLAFLKYRNISKAMAEHSKFAPPPESVTSTVAKEEVWRNAIETIGSVASSQGVTLSAEESGKVVKINFESGVSVQAGQTLVELDTSTENAQLQSEMSKLELARVNLARGKTLRPTNAVSQSDLDTWTYQAKQYEGEVAAIKATIAKKLITAPFAGKTGIRLVNVGQFVRQGDPIVPLHALDPVFVNFSVPQQQLVNIKVGQEVEVRIDAFAGERFVARITAVNPQVDESTRNASVQATLPNPEQKIRPGMYATVAIQLDSFLQVIPIPASSINYAPYGNSVYVIEPTKDPAGKEMLTVRQQFVKLGPSRGDLVAVLPSDKAGEQGLKAGEQVVTSGTFKLRPGGQVLVNNSVTPSSDPNPHPADT